MSLSITLRDANLRRVEFLPDLGDELATLRDTARGSEIWDRVPSLRTIDPFGATIFNWLQVDDLMTDLRLATAAVYPAGRPELSATVDTLEGMCRQAKEKHWYVYFLGD